jgi:peptide/nickel transport system substrate-binding protein
VSNHISRRTALTVLVGGGVGMALAACGNNDQGGAPSGSGSGSAPGPSASGSQAAPASSGSAAGTPGGQLSVVFPNQEEADAKSLDPNVGGGATYVNSIYGSLYDQLVYQDPTTGKPVPGLATWDVSSDGLTYTFHLNRAAKFHDGTPVTTADVKFSLDRSVDPKYAPGNATGTSVMAAYKESEIIDPATIKVTLKTPSANFLWSAVGRTYLAVVPKAYVEKVGIEAFGQQKPMGSGPFQFVEWQHGDHITVKRNPNYSWGPSFFKTSGGPALLDSIVFRFIQDPATRLAALTSGQSNAIQGIAPFDQAGLESNPQFAVIQVRKNGQPGGLNLNTQNAATDDLAVRQAISYAVDRDALNKAVYAGVHFPAYTLLEEKMGRWVNKDAVLPKTDVAKAKEILDAAGWAPGSDGIRAKNGKRLSLVAVCGQDLQQALTLIQAQVKAAGIDLQIQAGSTAQVSSLLQAPGNGAYNVAWSLLNGRTNEDPYVLRTLFSSKSIPGGSEGTANASRVNLPELDKILDQAAVTLDDDKRQDLYYQAQKTLVDYVGYVPLLSINQNWGVVKGVNGIFPDVRGTYTYFNDAWLDPSIQGRWHG